MTFEHPKGYLDLAIEENHGFSRVHRQRLLVFPPSIMQIFIDKTNEMTYMVLYWRKAYVLHEKILYLQLFMSAERGSRWRRKRKKSVSQ